MTAIIESVVKEALGLPYAERVQVGSQTGMLRDTGQHPRPDFLGIMKDKHKIWKIRVGKSSVGAGLALDSPATAKQGCQKVLCLDGRPLTHAAEKAMEIGMGLHSDVSSRSASTRRASASALVIASSAVAPYTRTPGNCGTSAIQRPSSSCSYSIVKFMVRSMMLDGWLPEFTIPNRARLYNNGI